MCVDRSFSSVYATLVSIFTSAFRTSLIIVPWSCISITYGESGIIIALYIFVYVRMYIFVYVRMYILHCSRQYFEIGGEVQSTSLQSSPYPLRVSLLCNQLPCTCKCISIVYLAIIIEYRSVLHAIILMGGGCSSSQKRPRENTDYRPCIAVLVLQS